MAELASIFILATLMIAFSFDGMIAFMRYVHRRFGNVAANLVGVLFTIADAFALTVLLGYAHERSSDTLLQIAGFIIVVPFSFNVAYNLCKYANRRLDGIF